MVNVACAIIRNDEDEILVVQRGATTSNPLKWEFPGGKVKQGESVEACLIREVNEELSMDIVIRQEIPYVEYDYGTKQIRLIPFICDTLDEEPMLSEHLAFRWLDCGELLSADLSEADIHVAGYYLDIVNKLTEVHIPVTDAAWDLKADDDFRDLVRGMKSLQEAEWIAASAIENPDVLLRLFEYSFGIDSKLAFRSSWTISKVFDKKPELIYPHLNRVIEELNNTKNESTRRSFLRILSLTDLHLVSRRHHGVLADHCMSALNTALSAIAIKAYSMEIIYKLALIYPELANELSASISMIKGEGAAGVVARGRIILKKLANLNPDQGSSPV